MKKYLNRDRRKKNKSEEKILETNTIEREIYCKM